MAKCKQTNKKRFKTLLLTFVLLLASCVYVFSACGTNKDDDNEDESTTKTDTHTFANADFEYFDNNGKSYLIPTANNWSRSSGSNALGNTAASSLAKSGIVDTSLDWSSVFTQARKDYTTYRDTDKEDIPDSVNYYSDIDNDYDMPGWDLAKDANDALTGDDKKELTVDSEEVKKAIDAANPGTRWGDDQDKTEENGTNVLLLHNYRSDRKKRCTAAKFTSTSMNLPANTAAKVSVWVKTYGMTDYKGNPVNDNMRGAYVALNNTVGGNAQNILYVNNINTKDVTENNGWQQFTFYIKASDYANATFSLVLGLGQGGGDTVLEYVDGYAFFDDVEYSQLTTAEYDEATENLANEYTYKLNLNSKDDTNKKNAFDDTRDNKVYALDLTTNFAPLTVTVDSAALTEDSRGNNANKYLGTDITHANDIKGELMKISEIMADSRLQSRTTDLFKEFPFDANSDVLLISGNRGANYTAKLANQFTVGSEEYLAIGFWVKTSDMSGGTGATVTLRDQANTTTIGAVDTSTLTGVNLKDDENSREDIFNGWQQCFLFVENQTKNELSFTLEFSFGPTTITDTTLASYKSGFAAFTGFESKAMSKQEFDLKNTGTYAVTASLVGNYKSATVGGGFDDVAHAPVDKIETGFAGTRAYDGVRGNSAYVGGSDVNPEDNRKNDYEFAGLLNQEYSANYFNNVAKQFITQYNSYTNAAVTADNWWSEILGRGVNQPLFITNPNASAADFSYGYVAKSNASLSTSSYTAISYRVMLSPGAVAYLYLIDPTAPENLDEAQYTDSIAFSAGVSYYYDEDGNLAGKNPESDDFTSRSDLLLYKQSNGLWAESRNYKGSNFYANLSNYEQDEDGNLTDGNKIVYYLHDGVYYRYHNEKNDRYTVAVKDFKDTVKDNVLTQDQLNGATIQTAQKADLVQRIEGTNENAFRWITVNFFIANGDTSKNYRLEVWNGSRDGKEPMAANSYVVFDKVNGTSLNADNYNNLLADDIRSAYPDYADQSKLAEAYEKDYTQFIKENGNSSLVYYHFSLFDDAQYKPYDSNYDSEKTGDPYSEYNPTTYDNTIAYFRYNTENSYNTYVNFGAVEKTVSTATNSDDDNTDNDTDDNESNVWLLISSIVLAVILILTLVTILVRKLVTNMKKGKQNSRNTYSTKRTHYMRKLKLAESQDVEEDNEDVVLPDDEDEIDEAELYSNPTPEVIEEDTKNSDSAEAEEPAESDSENKDNE